jgi:hypothetical protein
VNSCRLTAKSAENGQNSMENASKYRRIKRQTQPEVALRRQARGQVAGILRSMSRAIAMKAFTVGDKVCPFYLKTLASNVHKSGGINGRTPVPGPVAAAVTCWIERVNEANEKARRICSGGL